MDLNDIHERIKEYGNAHKELLTCEKQLHDAEKKGKVWSKKKDAYLEARASVTSYEKYKKEQADIEAALSNRVERPDKAKKYLCLNCEMYEFVSPTTEKLAEDFEACESRKRQQVVIVKDYQEQLQIQNQEIDEAEKELREMKDHRQVLMDGKNKEKAIAEKYLEEYKNLEGNLNKSAENDYQTTKEKAKRYGTINAKKEEIRKRMLSEDQKNRLGLRYSNLKDLKLLLGDNNPSKEAEILEEIQQKKSKKEGKERKLTRCILALKTTLSNIDVTCSEVSEGPIDVGFEGVGDCSIK